jgi:WW domain
MALVLQQHVVAAAEALPQQTVDEALYYEYSAAGEALPQQSVDEALYYPDLLSDEEDELMYDSDASSSSLPPPPPPPPPPTGTPQQLMTWHAVWSDAHERYYYCNLSSKATTWDKPEGTNCRIVLAKPKQLAGEEAEAAAGTTAAATAAATVGDVNSPSASTATNTTYHEQRFDQRPGYEQGDSEGNSSDEEYDDDEQADYSDDDGDNSELGDEPMRITVAPAVAGAAAAAEQQQRQQQQQQLYEEAEEGSYSEDDSQYDDNNGDDREDSYSEEGYLDDDALAAAAADDDAAAAGAAAAAAAAADQEDERDAASAEPVLQQHQQHHQRSKSAAAASHSRAARSCSPGRKPAAARLSQLQLDSNSSSSSGGRGRGRGSASEVRSANADARTAASAAAAAAGAVGAGRKPVSSGTTSSSSAVRTPRSMVTPRYGAAALNGSAFAATNGASPSSKSPRREVMYVEDWLRGKVSSFSLISYSNFIVVTDVSMIIARGVCTMQKAARQYSPVSALLCLLLAAIYTLYLCQCETAFVVHKVHFTMPNNYSSLMLHVLCLWQSTGRGVRREERSSPLRSICQGAGWRYT